MVIMIGLLQPHLEDMFRACAFGMATLSKAFCRSRKMSSTLICWDGSKVNDRLKAPELIEITNEKLGCARRKLKAGSDRDRRVMP
ncbi:hypothetical protein Tco_0517254 [Tanacetum coccineum]